MKKTLFTFLAALLCAATTPFLRAEGLQAGAATGNITPYLGVNIIGNFGPMLSVHVHDELQVRSLVISDGKQQLAFVVCDLLGLKNNISTVVRKRIESELGIPYSNVMISGTHTHSAGSALGSNRHDLNAPLDTYQEFVAARIFDSVKRALNLLRPAEITFGKIEAPEYVFNRRWLMKPGANSTNPFGIVEKARMNPPTMSEDLIEPAGPTDPELSFIAFREPGGRLISLLAAYSLHYVGGVPSGDISADYFAVFSEALKAKQPNPPTLKDAPFVAMLANGTSGDINSNNYAEKSPSFQPYEKMDLVANDLANRVQAALEKAEWKSEAKLAADYVELDLKRKPLDPALITWSEEKLKEAPKLQGKVDIPLIYAERIQTLTKEQPDVKVPLQHFQIGDIGIGTFPTETFAETGLEYKQRSPFRKAFMISLAHGYLGYLPTPRHFELGGYETWPGTNQLEPQASVKMLEALLEMANKQAKAE